MLLVLAISVRALIVIAGSIGVVANIVITKVRKTTNDSLFVSILLILR